MFGIALDHPIECVADRRAYERNVGRSVAVGGACGGGRAAIHGAVGHAVHSTGLLSLGLPIHGGQPPRLLGCPPERSDVRTGCSPWGSRVGTSWFAIRPWPMPSVSRR